MFRTTSLGFTKEQLYSTASYQAQDSHGVNLENNDITGWDFAEQNLTVAFLRISKFTNANLTGANLTNASLGSATLANTDLAGANVKSANLADAASLSSASPFEKCRLTIVSELVWPFRNLRAARVDAG